MFEWNNPYVLAVIIGLIAASANYYTQKQNKSEVNMTYCIVSFFVASGVLMGFYYFTMSGNSTTPSLQTGGAQKLNLHDLKIQPGLPDF